MGWLGLAIAVLWPLVVCLMIKRQPLCRPDLWTLLNLVTPGSAWAMVCFAGLSGASLQWVCFGLGLPVFPMAAQALTARTLARSSHKVSERWSAAEFTRYFVSNTLMLTAPSGLILALLGFAYSRRHDPSGSALALLLAAIGFLFLWSLMWTTIRDMRVPGRLSPFPSSTWQTELQRLARRMGAPKTRFFLARTRAGRIAGAYCLGSSAVGIADALLAALDMEEFKSVMAHEIWHLGQVRLTGRYLILSSTTILFAGLSVETLGGSLPADLGHVLALGIVLVTSALFFRGLIRLKRRQEDEADEAAVAFVGALPMISALVKATLLNGGRFDRSSARYRSLEERIRRLASLGGCSDESVEAQIQRARLFVEPVAASKVVGRGGALRSAGPSRR